MKGERRESKGLTCKEKSGVERVEQRRMRKIKQSEERTCKGGRNKSEVQDG